MSADPVVQPPRSHVGARPLPMPHTLSEVNVLQGLIVALGAGFQRLGDAPTLAALAVALDARAHELAKGSSVDAQFLSNDFARLAAKAQLLAETCRGMEC